MRKRKHKQPNNIHRGLIIPGIVLIMALLATLGLRWAKESETSLRSIKNCSTYDGTRSEQCANDYIGLPLEVAVNKGRNNNLSVVVARKDGEWLGVHDIFREAPIYFFVDNGIVVHAYFEHDRSTHENCTAFDGRVVEPDCANEYINLAEASAIAKAKTANLKIRVIEKDGTFFPVNLDLRRDRINLSIRNGVVEKAEIY